MSDIVRDLLFRASDQEGIGWTPTTVVPVPAGLLHRAADDIKRLNRELDDVWDALAIQREDNASFGDAFKRMTSEIERLRAALREIASTERDSCSEWFQDIANAALAEEKP
jgi:septal ring factor EnvC (AmiA/AmiB activator)